MTLLPFRTNPPARSYTGKVLNPYTLYKDFLEKDFNERCGYTDCTQSWFGGKRNFQIDHFKPKSIHPELETAYANLIYACSYVNRAKSDDMAAYIDPCDVDYNQHFYRDSLGNIFPNTNSPVAKYMYKRLKLFLKRYSIIWMLDQLEIKKEVLRKLIEATGDQEALKLYSEIDFKYMDYKKYLKALL